MSERQRQDWHKVYLKGFIDKRDRGPSITELLLAPRRRIWSLPPPLHRPERPLDSRGNGITLQKVKWVEDFDKKYDEKGNPR